MPVEKWIAIAGPFIAAAQSSLLFAAVEEHEIDIGGATVQYKVVLPDDFDPEQAYPAILVFGGGPQTMRTIDGTLERNFRNIAEKLGYIVVGPAAPDGELFFQDGARIFPAFLAEILARYRIRNEKFHAAGPSNGGIAAFHVAARNPDYFLSVTAFPGYLWQPTNEKLIALSNLCVFAYIGEHDRYQWHGEMRREIEYLNSLGTLARFVIEDDQPHRLETLAGPGAERLFENFALAERGCRE
ncbi:MAG: alpha/beta hydrolase-fold protein [Gammaproteobacteria bacterium]|jgi:poly(3-hydroxybutyrate) depolymerase